MSVFCLYLEHSKLNSPTDIQDTDLIEDIANRKKTYWNRISDKSVSGGHRRTTTPDDLTGAVEPLDINGGG